VRALVRVPWISLPNIVLGRAVVPELYQRAFTPERVADTALSLLAEPAAQAAQRQAFAELAGMLGEPGVGLRAARHIVGLLGPRPVALPTAARTGAGGAP